MKIWSLVLVVAIFCPSLARAADPPVGVDSDKLKSLLEGLGYKPEPLKVGSTTAWRIELKHPDEKRKHLVFVDSDAGTVCVLGGGFSSAPDPKKASNAWYRKLLGINHKIAPSYIFINDGDVFGLATVFGNNNITPSALKAKIELHVSNFDKHLIPLIKELTK